MGTVLDFYNEYNNSDWVGQDIPDDIMKRYEIKACLKMSEDKRVYLVTSKTNWKKYILKALASHCHESLEEEYKLSKELSHPGLVDSLEYIKGTNFNYLIREYVEGYTVTELVEMTEEGHLEEEELRQLTLKLCDILQYLHTQKPPIIHRDIKPDNVIITKQNECRLIDFGISRRYQGNVDSDTFVMGTQYSAPPEQFGFTQTDERSDIYSIGVLMFYMATGSLDIRDLKHYHLSGDIRRIIDKCTRFSPKERYTSVKQLKNKLISYPYIYKKRRIIYASGVAVATAFIIGLFYFADLWPMNGGDIKVEAFDINHEYEKVVMDNSSKTNNSLPVSDATDSGTEQPEESSDPESTEQNNTELVTSGTTNSNSKADEVTEIDASGNKSSDNKTSANESSNENENTAKVSDIEEERDDRDNTAEPLQQEPKNTLQEAEDTQTTTPIILDEEKYDFKSPLIEAAVREQLGRSASDAVTYKDLEQITSLLICGQQRYERWDEHFVYGVNQHMTDPKYTKTQIYMNNGDITSLEDISYMVNLEKLAMYNQKISDLSPLKDLHYLSYLGLGSNNISDLTPITAMKSLNYLDLSGNPIMNDELEILQELPYLWGLDLGATKVTSVYGIKDLKLSYLSLFECKMGDCVGLDEITTLDNLILTGVNNAITNQAIDRVAKLTNLKIFKIFGSDGFDLSKLSKLKSLYLLDLCGMWGSSNLKDLGDIPISQLYISFMKKLDLNGIENLSSIEQINMKDSICSDYSPLLRVKKLKTVYCNQEQMKMIKEQLGEVPFEIIAQ